MKILISLLVIAGALTTSVTAAVSDVEREGSVLGGGVGFAPVTDLHDRITRKWDGAAEGTIHESEAGLNIQLLAGLALNDRNLLVVEFQSAVFAPDAFAKPAWLFFVGPVWYRYFAPGKRVFFTAVGAGISSAQFGGNMVFNPGPGILVGSGVTLTSHWQIGLYTTFGTSYGDNYDKYTKHDNNYYAWSLQLTGIAF